MKPFVTVLILSSALETAVSLLSTDLSGDLSYGLTRRMISSSSHSKTQSKSSSSSGKDQGAKGTSSQPAPQNRPQASQHLRTQGSSGGAQQGPSRPRGGVAAPAAGSSKAGSPEHSSKTLSTRPDPRVAAAGPSGPGQRQSHPTGGSNLANQRTRGNNGAQGESSQKKDPWADGWKPLTPHKSGIHEYMQRWNHEQKRQKTESGKVGTGAMASHAGQAGQVGQAVHTGQQSHQPRPQSGPIRPNAFHAEQARPGSAQHAAYQGIVDHVAPQQSLQGPSSRPQVGPSRPPTARPQSSADQHYLGILEHLGQLPEQQSSRPGQTADDEGSSRMRPPKRPRE